MSLLGVPSSQRVTQGFLGVAHPAWRSQSRARWGSRPRPGPSHRRQGLRPTGRAAERLATAQLALEGMGRDGGRRLVLSVTSSLRSASWGAEGPCPVSMSEGT